MLWEEERKLQMEDPKRDKTMNRRYEKWELISMTLSIRDSEY